MDTVILLGYLGINLALVLFEEAWEKKDIHYSYAIFGIITF